MFTTARSSHIAHEPMMNDDHAWKMPIPWRREVRTNLVSSLSIMISTSHIGIWHGFNDVKIWSAAGTTKSCVQCACKHAFQMKLAARKQRRFIVQRHKEWRTYAYVPGPKIGHLISPKEKRGRPGRHFLRLGEIAEEKHSQHAPAREGKIRFRVVHTTRSEGLATSKSK